MNKTDVLPNPNVSEWDDRIVVFWCHGGGFGAGTAMSFATAHCEIISLFSKNLDTADQLDKQKQLLYFSLEYPLAPEFKHPHQLQSAISAYFWLVQNVGVKNIVIGGDSAGANLVLSLHRELGKEKVGNEDLVMPKSMVIISPWLVPG